MTTRQSRNAGAYQRRNRAAGKCARCPRKTRHYYCLRCALKRQVSRRAWRARQAAA